MKPTILLVEDNEDHAELLRVAFERSSDTAIRVATTVEQARAELAKSTPDLIVADLRLPDGPGTLLIERDGPPLMVLTGQGDEWAAAAAMKAGAIDYLVKSEHVLLALPQIAVRALREHEQKVLARRLRNSFVDDVIAAQDDERRRIARELHDELGQALISLSIGLERLKGATSLDEARAQADRLQGTTEQLALGLSRLAQGLHPWVLEELGLAAAFEQHITERARAEGFEAHVEIVGLDAHPLPKRVASALFRIMQEALTNIYKHAHASCVQVLLHRDEARARLVVEDDGCGFDATGASQGLGLNSIRERAQLLGGWAEIESEIGQGGTSTTTVLIVQIPAEVAVP